MDCRSCRESVSARLDGEDDPSERTAVDAHLAGCAPCRAWADDATAVTRLVRMGLPTPPSPGVDDRIIDAAPGRRWARSAQILRWVLGGLGAAQFVLAAVQIVDLARSGQVDVGATHGDQMASSGHLWHESAAWNLAVGVGFAWIAARRGRPAAIAPMLTVFVAVLALLSADDLVAGRVEGVWLLSHGFVVAGYVIIVLLSRPTLDFDGPLARRRRPGGRRRSAPPDRRAVTGRSRPPDDRSTPAGRDRGAA